MRERKRNRLSEYDYSKDNLYFVTSCVQDRLCCLGNVVDDKMNLNEFGKIAHDQLEWLENQYSYVVLHEFVVMPNHIHAIIEINRNLVSKTERDIAGRERIVATTGDVGAGRDVGAGHDLPLPIIDTSGIIGENETKFTIKIKSLSELIGAYKTTSSKQIHAAGLTDFKWQRSFHDHIIRNDKSYGFITNYISRNPEKWHQDDIFPNETI